MNTTELSTASAGEAFQWPKMPDLRYHGEYRRGYANCLDDVKRAFEAAPGRAPLTDADMEDLKRLREVFDDGQGYDVPKERMKRLAELGVVRWHGREVYSITAFGMYCLGDWEFPLRTAEEINAELHAEMLARNGIAPAGGIGGEKP